MVCHPWRPPSGPSRRDVKNRPGVFSILGFWQAGQDLSVTGHALRVQSTVFQGFKKGAARLAVVFAVAKAALPDQLVELDKASLDIITADMHQAELANAG
jgi:hypothetical protein